MTGATATPGLIISAPASGTGKTTVTLGLSRALARSGLTVQPFKSGPDYIDPAFHAAATGRASVNLDTWAMPSAMIAALAALSADADIVIAEGSMGLFDGVAQRGETGTGASADLATLTGWPVVLVLDVSGQAQTAAAIAHGLATFRPGVRVAGVILNRVASPRHETLVRAGMEAAGITVLGALARRASVALPERHLGLVQAREQAGLDALLDELAEFIAGSCDLAGLKGAARAGTLKGAYPGDTGSIRPPGQRIALASDDAFSFVYPHLIEAWRTAGAEILPFSPLADEAPEGSADICWLPGGYPELHAGTLAAATAFRAGLRRFAETRPVHGECGGYMAMGEALIDKAGTRHAMAGLLGLVTSYENRRMHLGYRQARLENPMPDFATGQCLRGHEFHYSTILDQPDEPLAAVTDASGARVAETGSRRGNATGTFFHLIAEAS